MATIQEQHPVELLLTAINSTVRKTGMPVVGFTLDRAMDVKRQILRKLVYKGLLKAVDVTYKGQLHRAYYTEDVLPQRFFEREQATTEARAKEKARAESRAEALAKVIAQEQQEADAPKEG